MYTMLHIQVVLVTLTCSIVCLSALDSTRTRVNYAENPMMARELSLLENILVKKLSVHLSTSKCKSPVEKYLFKHNRDNKAFGRLSWDEKASHIVSNGLRNFKMIHRIVVLLQDIQKSIECKLSVKPVIETVFTSKGIPPPSELDTRESILGILRIHFIYGLNATSQIRLGILGTINTGAILDFDENFSIARQAIELELNVLAYQWLAAAELVSKNEKEAALLDKAWLTLAFQARLNCTELLHSRIVGRRQLYFPGLWPYKFYAPCRGENGQGLLGIQQNLRCYYHTLNNLINLKTEILSTEPPILHYHDFLSDRAVQFLKSLGSANASVDPYEASKFSLNDDEEDLVSNYGKFLTAVNCKIKQDIYEDGKQLSELLSLDKTIEKLTGMNVDEKDIGMILYGAVGGYFDIHQDSYQNSLLYNPKIGDRIGNFLMFMGNTKLGGFLGFPFVGTHVKPQKGDAVVWFNTLPEGIQDIRTVHVGCPVILGEKHIVRFSMYEYDNMWNYPCNLNGTQVVFSDEILHAFYSDKSFY